MAERVQGTRASYRMGKNKWVVGDRQAPVLFVIDDWVYFRLIRPAFSCARMTMTRWS